MGKELIITASRHETKVAVMEDEQLTEIYFERANEYSLAGSIHKGRVTRVLPGMQSAFVDIGLERDAFLYVSDFFYEQEEFEDLAGAIDVKPATPEPGRRSTASAEVAAPAAGGAPAAEAEHEEGGRERRGRRGRRRRGRSGGKGLIPESKYAAPSRTEEPEEPEEQDVVAAEAEPEQRPQSNERERGRGRDRDRRHAREREREREPEPEAAEESSEEDVLILPGESLAKYRRGRESVAARDEDTGSHDFDEESNETASVSEEIIVSFETGHAESLEEAAEDVSEDDAEEKAEAEAAEETAPRRRRRGRRRRGRRGRGHDNAETSASGEGDDQDSTDDEETPDEEAEARVLADARAEHEAPGTSEPEDSSEDEEAGTDEDEQTISEFSDEEDNDPDDEEAEAEDSDDDSPVIRAGSEEEDDADEGEEEGEAGDSREEQPQDLDEDDGPAPVRIPLSLTATLRERGGRYLQRRAPSSGNDRPSGRRRRRRGRGNRQDDQQDNQASEPRAQQTEKAPAREPAPTPAAEARKEEPRREESRRERERDRDRDRPLITDLLKSGQEILVQIAKEPIAQKGARITSHIALPGRYVVYMPTVEHLGVSRKIGSEAERNRLRRILQTHQKGMSGGFIIRTAGTGKSEQEIAADMNFLYNQWLDIRGKAEKAKAPSLIYHDLNIVERVLRDQLDTTFKNIWVDNEEVYESTIRFVQRFQPTLVDRVRLYTRRDPIFESFGVMQDLEKALKPKVWLRSGGYIVINQTEALVAIDVNTGKYVGKSDKLEDTITKTNTEAVKEIARQMKLRDLGGIIVIDFIDMDERKNRVRVMQALEEAMRSDRAPYKILQFNDFGLVAITRKRVKQSLERAMCSPCPYCSGAGYVKSVDTVISEILIEAHKIARAIEGKDVVLRCNPEVATVVKSHRNQYLEELEEILKRPVIVKSDATLHRENFDIA